MTSSDFKTFLYGISENNGDCSLPCIWGINPVTQTPEDFLAFIRKPGNIDAWGDYYINSASSELDSTLDLMDWEGNWETDISFRYRGRNEIEYLFLDIAVFETQKSSEFFKNQTSPFLIHYANYLLPQIFNAYGKPTNIYFGPDPEDDVPTRQSSWIPFSVLLFYPSQGFLIDYLLPKNIEGDYFTGCLSQVNELTIISWNPNEFEKFG